MLQRKFVARALMIAALTLGGLILRVDDTVGEHIDPVGSTATVSPGPHCWVNDPAGGGDPLYALGAVITVTARDIVGDGVSGIPASDYWLIGPTDAICLCGGSASINADSASNADGQTTISDGLRGGGYDAGVHVVIQAFVILNADLSRLVLPITPVSPDIDCDLRVDLPDFALFKNGYTSPPKPYEARLDFDCDGVIDLPDFAIFIQHYEIAC